MNEIEINLNAINANVNYFRGLLEPETKLIGVVKANAYGHGLVETGRVIWTSGADILATTSVAEAVMLRLEKIKAPIIVLGAIEKGDFQRIIDFDLTVTIYDFETAYQLARAAKAENKWVKLDLKIDTGLSRYGFKPPELLENYRKISALEHVKVVGIHSHFANVSDKDFSKEQIKLMQAVLFSFQQNSLEIPMTHMAATDATVNFPEAHFDAVRIGIGLYGYGTFDGYGEALKPALELKSTISCIRIVGKGETVGYRQTYKAKEAIKAAVIPLGYFDGYPRALSNKAEVLIGGKRAKVIGLVCMNAMLADVTGIKCAVGDEVTLIGRQGNEMVTAMELAHKIDTIPHEILCRLPEHLPRKHCFK